MPVKRSFGVTLLLWTVLMLTAWGIVRLLAALRFWNVLIEFGARLSPLYLFVTGAGWVVAGCVLFLSMWNGKAWGRVAIPAAAVIWVIQYWIERLFFQSPRSNWPFSLIATFVLLVIPIASALHRNTKSFFKKSEEYEQPDKNSKTAGT